MNKLIKLIFLMSFYANYYCSACAIEEGVYVFSQSGLARDGCGVRYDGTDYFYLEAQPDDNTVKTAVWCREPMHPEASLAPRAYLWSVESTNEEGHYKVCSDTKMGIRCLEADPNLEGRSLIKLGSPSSHENQLWSIKPFQEGYSICSDILPFEVRCLNQDGSSLRTGNYQAWSLEETYYRFNNLERSNKRQNIRFNDLEKSNKRQNIWIDSLDSSNQQQDLRLETLEEKLSNQQQNIRLETLEKKVCELIRTNELQANELSSFGNRLRSLEQLNEQVNLFRSSFVSGAAYSLIPEIIKDGIEFSGYPKKAANVAAIVAQGAMVAYNTVNPLNPSSYASTITGMAARYGSDYLGYSKDTSIVVGSTVAIVTTVLFSPEETTLDCITGCAIALAGSYAGSTLALKAKSWIYDFWHNEQITSLTAQAKSLTAQASSWAFERISFYGLWNSGDNTSQKDLALSAEKIILEKDQRIEELEQKIRLLTKEQ
jgi:hypothetical protein